MKNIKFYIKNLRIKEIENFRKKYDLRPLIFSTTNQINNLYLSYNDENQIYNKNNLFLINLIKGISYFDDDDIDNDNDNKKIQTKFLNLEYGLQYCLKYKFLAIRYSIGTLNISSRKPFIIFNDNLSINFNDFGLQLTHYSDWFLSKNKGYDVPYNLIIPINFLEKGFKKIFHKEK